MKSGELRKELFVSIVSGIFLPLLGTYVTGFGGFIFCIGIRSAIKSDPIADILILTLLGLGIMGLSILVWRAAVKEVRKARKLKAALAAHEDAPESASADSGRGSAKGLRALAAAIFGIVWMIEVWESGVWWFALLGMFFVSIAAVQAWHELKNKWKRQKEASSEESSSEEDVPRARKGRLVFAILCGVMAVYDIISSVKIFSQSMSEKALPMFVLFNVIWILAIIEQAKDTMKKPKNGR